MRRRATLREVWYLTNNTGQVLSPSFPNRPAAYQWALRKWGTTAYVRAIKVTALRYAQLLDADKEASTHEA